MRWQLCATEFSLLGINSNLKSFWAVTPVRAALWPFAVKACSPHTLLKQPVRPVVQIRTECEAVAGESGIEEFDQVENGKTSE